MSTAEHIYNLEIASMLMLGAIVCVLIYAYLK